MAGVEALEKALKHNWCVRSVGDEGLDRWPIRDSRG